MMEDLTKQLEQLLDEIFEKRRIYPEDIPGIDVYMDQLTTFMDDRLRAATRNPARDKVLTKTMINNYTKNDLLPPPVKKKYSREHLILLIYIFYLKSTQSIEDINAIILPLKLLFGHPQENGLDLTEVYRQTLSWAKDEQPQIRKDLTEMLDRAMQTFPDEENEKHRKQLRMFSFLAMLAYDLYVRQTLIEKILDDIKQEEGALYGRNRKAKGHKDSARSGKESGT